jgi:hypothetical protein
MRCANCNADNPPRAAACETCGTAFPRKPRKRGIAEESDSPFGPIAEASNRRAIYAYRFAVAGLIPGVGLFAGPVALGLGCKAWLGDRKDPGFTAVGPLHAGLLLGALISLTNWIGAALMAWGLWSLAAR